MALITPSPAFVDRELSGQELSLLQNGLGSVWEPQCAGFPALSMGECPSVGQQGLCSHCLGHRPLLYEPLTWP